MLAVALAGVLSQTSIPAQLTLAHSAGASTERCPDQAWLEGNVAARLGYSPFVASAAVQATTRFDCTKEACQGTLEITRAGAAPGRRVLAFADCRELAESVALTLALAIDPVSANRPKPSPAPAAPMRAPAPVPVVPAVAPAVPVEWVGLLGVLGTAGVSPTINIGGRAGVGLKYRSFGITLEGRFDAPQAASVAGGRVDSSVLLGTLAPCLELPVGLGFCATVSAGALQVFGVLDAGSRASSPLLLAGARISYHHFFLRWFGVVAHLGVQGVVTRTTVTANGQPVWVTAPVAPDLGIAIVLRY